MLKDHPEYLFRPSSILKRVFFDGKRLSTTRAQIKTPWNLKLEVNPQTVIGESLWKTGTYELALTELLWRLTEPGSIAVDVGANIGYMTSLFFKKAGPKGRVFAFEPHPALFGMLKSNVQLWRNEAGKNSSPAIELTQAAVSDICGDKHLLIPEGFEANNGIARLISDHSDAGISNMIPVRTQILDDLPLSSDERIDILKIDTEGHEAGVLKGSHKLLKSRRIRNLVFEANPEETGQILDNLLSYGMAVFQIQKTFIRTRLHPLNSFADLGPNCSWEPMNLIATFEPNIIIKRFRIYGWECLRT